MLPKTTKTKKPKKSVVVSAVNSCDENVSATTPNKQHYYATTVTACKLDLNITSKVHFNIRASSYELSHLCSSTLRQPLVLPVTTIVCPVTPQCIIINMEWVPLVEHWQHPGGLYAQLVEYVHNKRIFQSTKKPTLLTILCTNWEAASMELVFQFHHFLANSSPRAPTFILCNGCSNSSSSSNSSDNVLPYISSAMYSYCLPLT